MSTPKRPVGRWLVGLCLLAGCGYGGARDPLELTTLDPFQDQQEIVRHYRHEAVLLRQKANELRSRAAVYEELFGAASEWVAATRLLERSYEEAARMHERLAEKHLNLGQHHTSDRSAGSAPR